MHSARTGCRRVATLHRGPDAVPRRGGAGARRAAREIARRLLFALGLLASALVVACAGEGGDAKDPAAALRSFLDGTSAVPDDPSSLAELNAALAAQAVRAHGYRAAGIEGWEGEGWSPVARREQGERVPADVGPWVEAGDIDRRGRFVPAEGGDPLPIEGLPDDVAALAGLEERLARLGGAVSRLAPAARREWAPRSELAFDLDDVERVARINPRVVYLVPYDAAAAAARAASALAGGSHGASPPPAGLLHPAGAPGEATAPATVGWGGTLEDHPRPTTSRNDCSCGGSRDPSPPEPGTTEPKSGGGCSGGGCSGSNGGCSGGGCSGSNGGCSGGGCSGSNGGCSGGGCSGSNGGCSGGGGGCSGGGGGCSGGGGGCSGGGGGCSGGGGGGGGGCSVLGRFLSAGGREIAYAATVLTVRYARRRAKRSPVRLGARARRWLPFFAVLAASVAASVIALAQAPAGGGGAPPGATPRAEAQAAVHHERGVRLLQAGNHAAAVAELREAQRLHPTPRTLQQLALAYKASYQYGKALRAYEELLTRHGRSLSADEVKAANDAAIELRSLIGYVRVQVKPKTARVTLDGEPISPDELGKPIAVSPGRHTLVAEQEGFAKAERTVDVASGAKEQVVQLKLVANQGYITVEAGDPALHIAIDGNVVGRGTYWGFLPPGRHLVQIYGPGGVNRAHTVHVEVGKAIEISNDDAPSGAPPPPPYPGGPRFSPPPPGAPTPAPAQGHPPPPHSGSTDRASPQRGFYGLLGGAAVWPTSLPYAFENDGSARAGLGIAVRAGYRTSEVVGFELAVDFARMGDTGIIVQRQVNPETNEARDYDTAAEYTLTTVRFGPGVRLATNRGASRGLFGFGFGAAHDALDLDHGQLEFSPQAGSYEPIGTYRHREYRGFDPFFNLEFGFEHQMGRALLGFVIQFAVQGTQGIAGKPYVPAVTTQTGFGLRAGYAAP